MPNLSQTLPEIARTCANGTVLTASTLAEGPGDHFASLKRWMRRRFDLHFVPLGPLGEQLTAVGYESYEWSLPGG